MAGPSPFPHRQQQSEASTESWVDVGSRPSSSSLSSAADEIITTGLRVQHDSNLHRRRRRTRSAQFQIGTGYRVHSGGNGSSQEEYDESESESDRVMTSSNEAIGPSPLQNEFRRPSPGIYSVASSENTSEREGDDEDDDDDENATAVNYPRSSRRNFEPRPNAFSHASNNPPVRPESGTTYEPRRPAARSSAQRHSYPQHTPYGPVTHADHDEALRASLSTLLSAAAAVRGLPKPGQPRTATGQPSNRMNPNTLCLVPESVALGEEVATQDTSSGPASVSSPRTLSSGPSEKSKRKDASVRSSSKDRRVAKKARKVSPLVEDISPTLFTWVVSAGVVVLVSALSFSAGYVVGKEAGHAEAMGQLGSAGSDAGRCGKEAATGIGKAGMGLRKLRWAGTTGIRV